MFVGTGTPRKPIKRAEARRLRRDGMPIKRIAVRIGVSPSSVHWWTKDILLTGHRTLMRLLEELARGRRYVAKDGVSFKRRVDGGRAGAIRCTKPAACSTGPRERKHATC